MSKRNKLKEIGSKDGISFKFRPWCGKSEIFEEVENSNENILIVSGAQTRKIAVVGLFCIKVLKLKFYQNLTQLNRYRLMKNIIKQFKYVGKDFVGYYYSSFPFIYPFIPL